MTRNDRRWPLVAVTVIILLVTASLVARRVLREPEVASPSTQAFDLVSVAERDGRFTTFVRLLRQSGAAEVLAGPGPFTVFAPTDEAFRGMQAATINLWARQPEQMEKVMSFHTIVGSFRSSEIRSGTVLSREGQALTMEVGPTGLSVNGAKVVGPDIPAGNGMLIPIDRVLIPPGSTDND